MRQNYQTGGISMLNTMAQNRAINNARRAAANTELEAPRNRILQRMQQNQANQTSVDTSGQTPMNISKHIDNNELLRAAVNRGELSSADYNRLGGLDVSKNITGGSNIAGGILNAVGSPIYNTAQAIFETTGPKQNIMDMNEDGMESFTSTPTSNQKLSTIPGTVLRNTQGGLGMISDDLKAQYESIINPAMADQPSAMPQGSPGQLNPTPTQEKFNGIGAGKLNPDGSLVQVGTNESGFPQWMELDEAKAIGVTPANQKPTMADVAGPAVLKTGEKTPDGKTYIPLDEFTKMKQEYITSSGAGENNWQAGQDFHSMINDKYGYGNITHFLASGGRVGQNMGGLMRLNYMIGGEAKQMEAGAPPIMYSGNMDPNAQAGLPSVPGPIQMAEDGPEFDMRENGGFQPLGRQEGKDDVPAMLAKNEFVMTADAVRAAGGGSIQKGAQKMYDTMKKLESRVS